MPIFLERIWRRFAALSSRMYPILRAVSKTFCMVSLLTLYLSLRKALDTVAADRFSSTAMSTIVVCCFMSFLFLWFVAKVMIMSVYSQTFTELANVCENVCEKDFLIIGVLSCCSSLDSHQSTLSNYSFIKFINKMKKDQYFPHEVSTRSNSQMMNLIEKEGMMGYGIYWALMEYLRVQDGYTGDLRALATLKRQLKIRQAKLDKVLHGYGLFVCNGNTFYSPKLNEVMKPFEQRRARIEAYKLQKQKENSLKISGEVAKPLTLDHDDLTPRFPLEERIYRMRCVEAWSMVVPWIGFPLHKLLALAEPTSNAKYVAFETIYAPEQMPGQQDRFIGGGLKYPYVEGLRLDEAMHPLTLMTVGVYGKALPPQNGAPVRLIVPWKYGFKGIKSIVSIKLTRERPPTTWNLAAPDEYGFYANVNPHVDHPRWSQATERFIGSGGILDVQHQPTLLFNGYADQVASLYRGLDLRENF